MNNEREYSGNAAVRPSLMPESPYTEDKRYATVSDATNQIRESIGSMRSQRDELSWNIQQAEKRLSQLTGDVLAPQQQAGAQVNRTG